MAVVALRAARVLPAVVSCGLRPTTQHWLGCWGQASPKGLPVWGLTWFLPVWSLTWFLPVWGLTWFADVVRGPDLGE